MLKIFRIGALLLLVVSVVSITLAVFAFIGKEKEYKKRMLVEDKLAVALKEKRELQMDLDMTEKAKEQAEEKITELEGEIEGYTEEIGKLKEENASTKEEVARLKKELEKIEREKTNITKQLEDLRSNYNNAKKNVATLTDEKTKLEEQLDALRKKTVELKKIVVSPTEEEGSETSTLQQSNTSSKGPLEGNVILVNRDYNFVVTDLNKTDGIAKGMLFEIRDGSNVLGKAEISKVYDTMSSATLLPDSQINKIRKGNIVIETP